MSNVHGLFSSRKNDDDDDEDESNNRFVGGISARGGGSGLAVLPNPNEISAAGSAAAAQQQRRDIIFGLAQEASNATEDNDDDNEQGQQQVRRTITMYQNGFIVDDGPYRRLDDPANAEFLRSLAMGRTPRELALNDDGSKNNNITVGLIDKRNEDYIEPFRSFSGTGETLGGGSNTTTISTLDDGVFDPTNMPPISVGDMDSTEMTSIAVRLPNGKRKIIKISINATISDLASQIVQQDDSGQNSSTPFRLMSGFPPQPITDITSTILSAGLKGAQISMHNVP